MKAGKRIFSVVSALLFLAAGFNAAADDGTAAGATSLPGVSVSLGGSFSFGLEPSWFWSWLSPPGGLAKLGSPDEAGLEASLSSSFTMDASAAEMFDLHGGISVRYPLHEAVQAFGADGPIPLPSLSVDSIYAVFKPLTWLRLTAGKKSYAWFPGYFFSPADYVNLSAVYPLEPDDPADKVLREGPVSMEVSFLLSRHSVSLLLMADDASKLEDLKLAARGELVFGPVTAGAGGYYTYQRKPSAFVTARVEFPVVTVFAESIFYFGSDRIMLFPAADPSSWPEGLDAGPAEGFLYNQSTGGITAAVASLGLKGTFQYLYNGLGYPFSSAPILLSPGVDSLLQQNRISEADLVLPARHYAAADVAWSIPRLPLRLAARWVMNFTDLSGLVEADFSVQPFSFLTAGFTVPFAYGPAGGEFSPSGMGMGLSFYVDLSTGTF
ncbi:MAG: hypothetical protein E4H36_11360 [Spirochaetales bacterium]|nr:MAG: hypothetical protein E4H36_11360 [Spirochaetales bacterium]